MIVCVFYVLVSLGLCLYVVDCCFGLGCFVSLVYVGFLGVN